MVPKQKNGAEFSGKLRAVRRREDGKPTAPIVPPAPVPEVGGRQGPEPTRYGDWELRGRCIDF